MSKKTLILLIVISTLVIVATLARFSTLEDTWICQNGTWVKHGNPSSPQPTTACGVNNPFNQAPVACTMDAKICPDGSAVGRVPPNCEFTPCPETSKSLLTEDQASKIAQNSCLKAGESITSAGSYNPNSKTWWFNAVLQNTPKGCSPACVVQEDQTTEINWRCTGFNP